MTDRKQRLAALADRIEQLQGPDCGVDAEVAAILRTGTTCAWADNFPDWHPRGDGRVYLGDNGPSFAAPHYTASLDAAMALVPEGWRRVNIDPNGRANVRLGNACAVTAATPALALCAAALRAQSETVA